MPPDVFANHPSLVSLLSAQLNQKDYIVKALSLFVLHQLLKSALVGNQNVTSEMLNLNAEAIYKIFEQNCSKGDSLLGMICSGLLSDMIALNPQTSQLIASKISAGGLQHLLHLIDVNQNSNKGDLRFVQGTNFGCPYSGFYDSPLALLLKA